jgi:plasmid stabilization system protein ParE
VRRLVWSHHARDEFRRIITYIAEDNPRTAESVASRIEATLERLAEMPTGRQGRVSGTYEKVVTGLPYIIAYALNDTPGGADLVVLHIIHGARDWPEGEWPEDE